MTKNIYSILQFFIWSICLLCICFLYQMKGQVSFNEITIEDRSIEYTPTLFVGDTLIQTVSLSEPNCSLDNLAVAFYYDMPASDGSILVEIYQGDVLTVEQPLPLAACPCGEYLAFSVNAEYADVPVTISITNLSAEEGFCLLSTSDTVRYENYTTGYQVNEENGTGSLFLRLQYPVTSDSFYAKATRMFLIFLICLIISEWLKHLYTKA